MLLMTATRTVAQRADLDQLLAPIASPQRELVRAFLLSAQGNCVTTRYDEATGVMHYMAGNGENFVRLSVAGLTMQQALLAPLSAADVLSLSAKETAKRTSAMFTSAPQPAQDSASPPASHPEVTRERVAEYSR